MPAPRGHSAVVDGTSGLGMSAARPANSGYGVAKVVSARDVDCPSCSAEAGQDCNSGRMSGGKHPVPLLCPDRLEFARLMRDSGELAITEVRAVRRCVQCASLNGKACAEHRCKHGACTQQMRPGLGYCEDHRSLHKGPMAKSTPEMLARMRELTASGMQPKEIAAELRIAVPTYYKYRKMIAPAA